MRSQLERLSSHVPRSGRAGVAERVIRKFIEIESRRGRVQCEEADAVAFVQHLSACNREQLTWSGIQICVRPRETIKTLIVYVRLDLR